MLMDLALNTTHTSSIGRWVLSGMATLLVFVGGCFLWISSDLIDARFDNFDAKFYEQQLMRVHGVLEQNRSSFELQLTDYAHWDDTEQFVLGNNPQFVDENLVPLSLDIIKVNGFVVTNFDGDLVTLPQLSQRGELVPMPEALWAALQPILPVLMTPEKLTANTEMVWVNNLGIMISGVTISDTIKNNAPSGYLFFIRIIDEAVLTDFRELTHVDFNITETKASDESTMLVSHKNSANGINWLATKPLTGLAAQIEIRGGTHLQAERELTFSLLVLSVAGLTFASLFGIYWIVYFKVLKRLHVFSELADQYRQEPQLPVRWPVTGHDELDNLALSLNEFITEVEVRHKDLSFLANHDPLTGIGNRRLLMERLDANMNQHQRVPSFVSTLLLLDLDGFKLLNDGLGHAAGDDILRLIAQRMTSKVRTDDTIVRLGGDEFAILLENIEPEMAHPFADRLLRHIAEPFEYAGNNLNLRASIGLAAIKSAQSKEDVIRNADLAMYEAKRLGKDQAVVFNIDLLDTVSRRMQLEQALQEALNEKQLEVWFQPVIDARNGKILGMEALSRWPLGGEYVPPDEFIAIAENSGMITKLGLQVFDKVGLALKELRVCYPELQCNVNLSVRQFRDSDLAKDIQDCIEKHQLPASALHLELTESMVAESETEILPTMIALVDQGFKFHLDDFGTGYSSLERLRNLPFNTLKIDRSFIVPLGQGDDVMVRNIINIGNELGMNLIAEGVETEVEVNKLLQLGCHQIQGYYFARPMPLEKLKVWLADNHLQLQQQTYKQQRHGPNYII
jgi:diguanylate cyclase (GGDEF)-like protein